MWSCGQVMLLFVVKNTGSAGMYTLLQRHTIKRHSRCKCMQACTMAGWFTYMLRTRNDLGRQHDNNVKHISVDNARMSISSKTMWVVLCGPDSTTFSKSS